MRQASSLFLFCFKNLKFDVSSEPIVAKINSCARASTSFDRYNRENFSFLEIRKDTGLNYANRYWNDRD